MADGKSYKNATIVLGSVTIGDVVRWSTRQAGEFVRNFADNRVYAQAGAMYRGEATLGFTTLDASALQGTGAPTLGLEVTNAALTMAGNNSASNMKYTLSRCVVSSIEGGGGYADPAAMTVNLEIEGTGGTEPTAAWATAT